MLQLSEKLRAVIAAIVFCNQSFLQRDRTANIMHKMEILCKYYAKIIF